MAAPGSISARAIVAITRVAAGSGAALAVFGAWQQQQPWGSRPSANCAPLKTQVDAFLRKLRAA